MAGFRTHVTVSTLCGIGYGAAAVNPLGFSPEAALLAAGLTGIGGMLPDLDSDSGLPVRELTGLAASILPLLMMNRLEHAGMSREGVLATLVGFYLFIRYGLSWIIRKLSVHRGMFHSIPAMLIAGLVVRLEYKSPDEAIRLLLASGIMIGFLSHLILDEIYSVDFNGIRIRLNQSAGSAVKFASPSWIATATCYLILVALAYLTYLDWVSVHGRIFEP